MILRIDISKASFDVYLLLEEKRLHKAFKNNPGGSADLQRWLKRAGVTYVHACLEATGAYGDNLAESLSNQGHTVSAFNPARTYGYTKSRLSRNKTDKGDAQLIALFCQSEKPEVWQPMPAEVKELRALVRRLENLTKMRVADVNRSKADTHSAVRASFEQILASLEA